MADGSFSEVADRYQKFVGFIHEQQLEKARATAPILNGNEIKTALGGLRGGPWLKKAVDMLAEWQFNHPEATKEQATEMIGGKKSELGLG